MGWLKPGIAAAALLLAACSEKSVPADMSVAGAPMAREAAKAAADAEGGIASYLAYEHTVGISLAWRTEDETPLIRNFRATALEVFPEPPSL